MIDDLLEQRLQVAGTHVVGRPGITAAAGGIKDGEIELVVVGFQRHEQIEHFIQHFAGARIRTVDLVDDDNRSQAQRQRLAADELGLRHRAFGSINQQNHAIDHRQDALHLAAEIGVARGVDDVDVIRVPVGIGPFNAGALGEDGDPAFLFQVIGIHGAFGHALVVAESAGLAEQLVDQGGLAMVDVRDDRDVAGGHAVLPDQMGRGWAGKIASIAPAISAAPIGQARRKGKSRVSRGCCTAAITGESACK